MLGHCLLVTHLYKDNNLLFIIFITNLTGIILHEILHLS
jgi:hypothetical protein